MALTPPAQTGAHGPDRKIHKILIQLRALGIAAPRLKSRTSTLPCSDAWLKESRQDEPTCVLVSHDRSFIRNVGTRFLRIERGRLREIEPPRP